MKAPDINNLKSQGFKYLGGGAPSRKPGDKNAYLFARMKSVSDGNVRVRKFANKTMFVYMSKSTSQLSRYGLDLSQNGSASHASGSFSSRSVKGLSFITTDDGVRNVRCGSAEVWASDGSHRGDGGFLIFGTGTFKADRNDSRGGRQLYYISFTNR